MAANHGTVPSSPNDRVQGGAFKSKAKGQKPKGKTTEQARGQGGGGEIDNRQSEIEDSPIPLP